MTAADADVPSPDAMPERVALLLPALGPHLAAALAELGEGEVLVAGERAHVEALEAPPPRWRREVETSGGVLVVERVPLGELIAAAMLSGAKSAAVDLGRVVARPADPGGALCMFALAGGCWWTRVRPEAAPAAPAAPPAAAPRHPRGGVVVALSEGAALAWLRMLGAWVAFGAPANAGPVAEFREALERAMGVR